MNGENPNPNPEIDNDEIDALRSDFDNALFDVHEKIKPYLEATVLKPFGLDELSFDLRGDDFDWDRSYSDVTKLSKRYESDNGRGSLIYDLYPGGMDISRFAFALEIHKYRESDLDFIDGSLLPHEMYAAGIITRAYLNAAQSEKNGETDHILEDRTGELRKQLRSTDNLEQAIGEEPEEYRQLLSDIINEFEPEEIMRIQSHRIAAGLYLHYHRSSEKPLQDELVRAMKKDLMEDLITITSIETIVHGAPDPIKSMSIDLELADITGADTDEVIQIFERNNARLRRRSERIPPSTIGWAYPASLAELAMLQAEINPDILRPDN